MGGLFFPFGFLKAGIFVVQAGLKLTPVILFSLPSAEDLYLKKKTVRQ